ncbi:protein 5NUC-like isoform X3 [Hermetia illucens]|uniref:protein 5NUC-like isoform X3 n=1 Tax=Hermetia illucens TaxID=343691 RepID=UPI0018CC2022|nr:protein 5NUC-like isoform X3 [Hermetia illucens]
MKDLWRIDMSKFSRYPLIGFLILCASLQWVQSAPIDSSGIEFIVLHNNDMHARFEQIGVLGNRCRPEDIASNNCYGGFARVAHEVRQFRQQASQPGGTPVVYLNAGDTYSGTPWFYIYRDNITAEFMNALHPDAISLGNHEFDDGVEGLIPFLNKATFPVLVANLNLTNQPGLAATKALKPSTILDVEGTKVGVIGYLTSETGDLSLAGNLIFSPEIDAINKEAERLKQQGIKIIIALGHSGFGIDQEIAKNCPLVDIVIGGHTNTFLYTGKAPDVEKPEGPYPTIIEQPSGKKVPVVQAYAYTKYLGHLKVKFDNEGNLLEWNGNPILLNREVPQDSDILKLLDVYRAGVEDQEQTVVGHTKVLLDGDEKNCREKECNLGNMVADALVYARVKEYQAESEEFWSDTAIAFMQGGGIRTSIPKKEDGRITRSDLIEVLPYGNKLVKVQVTGQTIRDMLEKSASKMGQYYGGFLQMSGVHVIYDASAPVNQRVKSVRVLCAQCNIPRYSDLEDEKFYNIIITDYILSGGDGYSITHNGAVKTLTYNDLEAVEDYIKDRTPVYPGVEWRIRIEGEPGEPGGGDGVGHIVASGLLILTSMLLHFLH